MKLAKCILFSLAFIATFNSSTYAANPKKVFKPNEMIGPLQKIEPMLDLRTGKPITLKGFATTKVKAAPATAPSSAPITKIRTLKVPPVLPVSPNLKSTGNLSATAKRVTPPPPKTTYAKEDTLAGPLGPAGPLAPMGPGGPQGPKGPMGPAGPANDLSYARPSTTSVEGIGLVIIPNGVKLIRTKQGYFLPAGTPLIPYRGQKIDPRNGKLID
jgi:hypothetical protein